MAENYSLEIITKLVDYFSPKIPQLTESFDKVSKKTKRLEDDVFGLNKAFGKIGESWKSTLGGMATAAVGFLAANKMKDFFTDIITSASDQQIAIAQLTLAIGRYNEELIEQANNLQKTTLYSDDATISMQSMLAMYVKDIDKLKTLTPLVQDFASKTGIDLNTAARLVTQSLSGTGENIGRYNANIKGASESNERFNSIVYNMNKLFGGSAKLAAEIGLGPLQMMKNNIDAVKADIGGQLLPYIKQFSDYIMTNIDIIKLWADSFVKLSMIFIQLGKSLYSFIESAINGLTAIIEFTMGSVVEFIHNVYRKVLQSADLIVNTFNAVRGKITGTKYEHSDLANTMAGEYSYLKLVSKEFWDSNVKHANKADQAFGKSIEELYNIGNVFKKQQEFIPKTVGGGGSGGGVGGLDDGEKKKAEKIYEDSLKRMAAMIPEAKRIRGELMYGGELDEIAKLDAEHRMVMEQLKNQLNEQLILKAEYKDANLQLQKEFKEKERIEEEKYLIRYNEIQQSVYDADKKRADDKLKLQKEQGIASSKELLSGLITFTSVNEKYKTLYKAAAISETLIATYSGATKAASSVAVIPGVGWSMAPFIAAAHVALGLANVARIAGVKMQHGGVVPGTSYNGDTVHTQLNSGELIMSPSMQANTLAAIGYGQRTTNNNNSNVQLSINIDNSKSTTSMSLDNLANALLDLHATKKLDKFLYKIGAK